MSNLGKKRLPFSKTVLFEFTAHLADVLQRTVRLKGSVASPLLDTNSFNNGDVNVTNDLPYVIGPVSSIVVLNSFDPFVVSLTDAADKKITLSSSGLFVHQGAVKELEIRPITGSTQIRLQYLWS